ncbi:hypothetical protein LTR17_027151 [Elasticomyces elasticus]|nr:hypothetical protein LTR17_027151 [Elasticomyces elasticus]
MQNKCLRATTGAYKSTNVEVLEHVASVEPLDLHLRRLAVFYFVKMEYSEDDRTVEAAQKATETRAHHRSKTKGTAPPRQVE